MVELTTGSSARWFLIVNPTTDAGRALIDYPRISRYLHEHEIYCDPYFTEYKSHAVELTVDAIKKGYRKIIVVGGDGTLHEVVNGIFIQQQVPPIDILLGVIAVGSGNDWARNYGFEIGNYLEMIKAIKAESVSFQDVGVVSYEEAKYRQHRYMVSVAGTGFDAYVVKQYAHRTMKRRPSRFSYLRCAVRSFFKYRHKGVKIYVDGVRVYNNLLFSAAVGVGRYNIRGIQQLPDAIPDDGLMDMTIIRPLYFWHILFRLFYLFDGNIYRIGHTTRWRGEVIRIESIPDMCVEVDGVLLGHTPLEISTLHRALKIVVHPSYLERS